MSTLILLRSGQHNSIDEGMCALEAVAWIAREPHSDHPQCVSPVIGEFCRSWNDGLQTDEERSRLIGPYLHRLPGTQNGKGSELRRGELALDWLVRVQAPLSLELVPDLVEYATALRGLPEIAAETVGDAVGIIEESRKARDAAWAAASSAARDAAWAAASYAAWDAASSAARDAASYAARDAAWAAASYAARDAAWAAASYAARDAASKKLQRMVEASQQSACDLLDRMIDVHRTDYEIDYERLEQLVPTLNR